MSRQYPRGSTYILTLFSMMVCMTACDSRPGTENHDKPAALEHVDAMSREHADDNANPNEAANIAPERSVVAERLAYAEVEDGLRHGYFVIPADMIEPLPAIILIHEWWGLNDGVRAMADRLAALGYIVLAVDLFGGKTAATPAEARQLMQAVVENPASANNNIRQAYQFVSVTAGAPRVAALGWCFGGGWSLNTALMFPDDLDAAVIYYGQVTDDENKLRPLNVPLLGIFAAEDRGIPVASVRRFEKALNNLGKDYEIEIFPGVGHAFANPSGNNYNADAADKAWTKTVAFLERHLASAAED